MLERTKTADETKALAQKWLNAHPQVKIWFLKGDLGAGKTCFVKGAATFFGTDEKEVKSPTFSLIEEHGSRVHADLYRLEAEDHFISQELDEHLSEGKTLFIEWPERLSGWEGKARAGIRFTHLGKDDRQLELNPLP